MFGLLVLAWFLVAAPNTTGQVTLLNIAHTNVGGHAEGVAVAGNFLYLANGEDGLRIFEVSNPSAPINLGHANNGGYAHAVAVSGNSAFLANDTDGVRAYDVTDPSAPVSVASNNAGGVALGVAASSSLVFAANGTNGLGIYQSAGLARLGVLPTLSYAQGVAWAGNDVYVADGGGGLFVGGVSDPTHPSAVYADQPDLNGYGGGVGLDGTQAYLANGLDGFRIYDISNPTKPVGVGHGAGGHGLLNSVAIAVADGYAYVANGLLGLSVYDVSTAANPTNLFGVNGGGFAAGVAVSSNYVYLADWNDGLRVYQVVPQLHLSATATNTLLVSWTTAVQGGSLQQSSNPASTNWTRLSPKLSVIGRQYQALVIPPASGPAYYRLSVP